MRAYFYVMVLLLSMSLIACGNANASNPATNSSGNQTGGNPGTTNTGGNNNGGSNNGANVSVAPDAIGGRVIDAASQAVPLGTVVVALESQQGDAKIVNATTPDQKGNFTFTQVPDGNYAIVVSAAVDRNTSYTPVLLVGGTKKITPGTYVGTIDVPHPTANSWATVNVPVQSDNAITVTLVATTLVNDKMYAIPWALDIPTFDTAANANCPNSGGACAQQAIQLPANAVLVGSFTGAVNQFKAAPSVNYYLTANAYTQSGSAPNCNPNALGPVAVSVSASQTTTADPFVFNNCK